MAISKKNDMLRTLALGMCAATLAFSSCADRGGKWEELFDGESLTGWKSVGGDAPYHVEDGMIVGVMTKGMPNSFLITEKEYGDFILELDVKLEGTETNSGIQTRSHIDPGANNGKGRVYGRQVEIDPSPRAWTGGIYDESRRGWLYALDLNEPAKEAYKVGEVNHIRIEAIGCETRTWVNDVPVSAVIDTMDPTGFIGLQVHSIPEKLDGLKVFFKNVRIQTENLKPMAFPTDVYVVNLVPNELSEAEKAAGYGLLFNGRDGEGWKSASGDGFPEKGWTVENGVLSVLPASGGGDIITERQYGAFDLSFEFRLTEGANSGVKYFAVMQEEIPGKWGAGFVGPEYQILDDARHPDAKNGRDGNRTLASLYDLIASNRDPRARQAIGSWNLGRITATPDGKVTHYLNGRKMVEYTRGSQEFLDLVADSKFNVLDSFGMAEKGHILLQDHNDAVSFRSVKIRELF